MECKDSLSESIVVDMTTSKETMLCNYMDSFSVMSDLSPSMSKLSEIGSSLSGSQYMTMNQFSTGMGTEIINYSETCKLSEIEMIHLLQSQEAELLTAVQLYQTTLLGLAAVCSMLSSKIAHISPDLTTIPSSPSPSPTTACCSDPPSKSDLFSERTSESGKKRSLRKWLKSSWNCWRGTRVMNSLVGEVK